MSDGPHSRPHIIEIVKKLIHIVLSSRILAGENDPKTISRSFNLEVTEMESVKKALNSLTLDVDTAIPLHLDICTSSNTNPEGVLLERWSLNIVKPASHKAISLDDVSHATTFQHALIMLRSLHSALRILPAHTLFCLGESALSRLDPLPFAIFFFINSGAPSPCRTFDGAHVKNFVFSPLNTGLTGILNLSVFYRTRVQYTAAIATPDLVKSQIISNYIAPSPSPRSRSCGHDSSVLLHDRQALALTAQSSQLELSGEVGPAFAGRSTFRMTPTISSHIRTELSANQVAQITSSFKPSPSPPLSTSPFVIHTEHLLMNTICNDGLGFARTEPGDSHAEVGAFLSVLRNAPSKLTSLETVQASVDDLFCEIDRCLTVNSALKKLVLPGK
uniref:Autophagy-related protein 13 N-terminal domain-containing protein n=1 Tax=Spongospora subterranea TaxID=70186 RepID=A0A0H5R6G5_9EUKA|eukprot:CRZ09426.1 hypothetical protein [Spongospora subterranea]